MQFAEDYHALVYGHGSIQKSSGDYSLYTVGGCKKINFLVTFFLAATPLNPYFDVDLI